MHEIFKKLPKTDKKVISILSGGLDSSSLTLILKEFYGSENIHAISFNYGQKQEAEIYKAHELCYHLGISHEMMDLRILGEITKDHTSNIVGSSISVPTSEEVEGNQQPKTYIPNRNMIMYSIVAAKAEVIGAEYIFCGVQEGDAVGYWDTTSEWVKRMNNTLSLNRESPIKLISPFSSLSKYDEIMILKDLDLLDYLKYTLSCYNPNEKDESCGVCPACKARIEAFAKAGIRDPIKYSITIDWPKEFSKYKDN